MAHAQDVHDHIEAEMDAAIRTKALEALLVENGLISTDAIDAIVRQYEQDIGPLNGAKVVARAWTDPVYKERLLADGTAAVAEMGYTGRQGAEMVILENTTDVHNVVVCTLCSCYPWPVLGLPPTWYKSFAYRSRVVREPRAVLHEFGLDIPESVEIRVWDSNSEVRYMVLPEQPPETENLSEEELVRLITRDAMIGVAKVAAPASQSAPQNAPQNGGA
jgi:nitrile hydratase